MIAFKDQLHVRENPNFPYAIGYPLIESEDVMIRHSRLVYSPELMKFVPGRITFEVGNRVKPNSVWVAERLGGFNFMVIRTRMIKRYKRQAWMLQVMIDRAPGDWYAAGHFDRSRI